PDRLDRLDRPEWTESVEWADHEEEEAADREERMEWLEREGRLAAPSRARAGSVRDEARSHARNQARTQARNEARNEARNQWSVVRGESEPVELGDLRAAGLVRPATEPAGVGVAALRVAGRGDRRRLLVCRGRAARPGRGGRGRGGRRRRPAGAGRPPRP